MARIDVTKNDAVVGKDAHYSFPGGITRCAFLGGAEEEYADYVHYDGSSFLCTKKTLEPARRDPQGRCYDCDQRADEAELQVHVQFIGMHTNPHGQPSYQHGDANLFWLHRAKLVGKRLDSYKLCMSQMAMGGMDRRQRDVFAICEDPTWQKITYQAAPEAWWMHPANQAIVIALWESRRHPAVMEALFGPSITYEQRVSIAMAKAQQAAGVGQQGRGAQPPAGLGAVAGAVWGGQSASRPAGLPVGFGAPAAAPAGVPAGYGAPPAGIPGMQPAGVTSTAPAVQMHLVEAASPASVPVVGQPPSGGTSEAELQAMLAKLRGGAV